MNHNFEIELNDCKISNYEKILSRYGNWKKYKREINLNQLLEEGKKIEFDIEFPNNQSVLYVSLIDDDNTSISSLSKACAVIEKMTFIILNNDILKLNVEVKLLTTQWGKVMSNLIKDEVDFNLYQHLNIDGQVDNFYFIDPIRLKESLKMVA
jgi:hypothetical protein